MTHLITSGSLIEGTFGIGGSLQPKIGNLEAVILEAGENGAFNLQHCWREQLAFQNGKLLPQPDLRWKLGRMITSCATGAGSICQRKDRGDVRGDFEVVVPEGDEIVHYSLVNSSGPSSSKLRRVIAKPGSAGPGAVLENRTNQHLEAVVLQGNSLVHYWLDESGWHRRAEITARANGAPAMIQSDYGDNLEVIVAEGDQLVLYWLDSSGVQPRWKPGGVVSKAGDGPIGFVQGRHGTAPNFNFEVLVPRGDVLEGYWRNNALAARPWGPAGWASWGAGAVRAAALCSSDLPDAGLQALTQEGTSIYQLYRHRHGAGFRWMRSACLRLEDDASADVDHKNPRSVKEAQITGGGDPPKPTLSSSFWTSGIRGTDLGVTVHHNQRHFLLFGDTHWDKPNDILVDTLDAIGEVDARGSVQPSVVLHGSPLTIVHDSADPITQDIYDVPLDAFSLGGQLFTFFSSNHFRQGKVMGRSVLTRATDPSLPINGSVRNQPLPFQFLTEFSAFRFINVSVQLRRSADVPGMGHEGHVLLVWGTGAYRADDLRLAVVPLRGAVLDHLFSGEPFPTHALVPQYFTGLSGSSPRWSPLEQDARPVFFPSALGEISVRWVPELHLYVLLGMSHPYFEGKVDPIKLDVFMRVAPTPWGPWSQRRQVFDWRKDGKDFIKTEDSPFVGDCIFKQQCESDGAAYAPYLFDVHWNGNTAAVRYTLSTWNPYQVMLMRHDITRAELRALQGKDSVIQAIGHDLTVSPAWLERSTTATLAFGGLMGDRIAANQRNWLLAAPTANPGMLKMFEDLSRDLAQNLLVWSGEYAGKYLISAVQGLRLTGDRHLRAEIDTFVDTLIAFQAAGGDRDGYLGPFGLAQSISGRRERPTEDRGPVDEALWDLWGQYHCMLGLYYAYSETKNAAALAACRRAADWFCRKYFDNDILETDVREWRFTRGDGFVIAERLRLLPNGTIGGHNHPNEVFWKAVSGGLSLYAADQTESTHFQLDPFARTPAVYRGTFLFDPSVTHVLTQVYYPAPEKNQACAHIFALLYEETNDPNYLRMLRKLEHAWQLVGGNYVEGFQNLERLFRGGPLARRWESLHSMQAVGELYRITGESQYRRAFQAVWQSIRDGDRHNTGGFSSLEEATGNPYDPRPIETCATIAWTAVCVDMLRMTRDAQVADELELTTWNAVLGAQHPDGRWWTYDTPMGGVPTVGMPNLVLPPPLFQTPPKAVGERRPARYDLHFQDTSTRGTSHLSCCAANGPRGLGILSEWAVMTANDGAITLNYYGPSVFTVRAPSGYDVSLVQETDYPVSGRISISVVPTSPEQIRLRLRIPKWSLTTTVHINGSAAGGVVPGKYLTVDRVWNPGDTIELVLEMGPRFIPGGAPPVDTDPNSGSTVGMASVYYGPLLLAYDRRLNVHDPSRVPRLLRSEPAVSVESQPGVPSPLVTLQFAGANGPITLCDFASAGFEFQVSPPRRPSPFVGWQFGRGDGTIIAAHLHLQRDGTIAGYSHPNEARWGFEGDVLVFYAHDGRASTRFSWVSIEDGRQILRGVSLFNRRIVHVLSEDDTSAWTRAWQFWRADGLPIADRLVLVAGGSVAGHHHPNEFRWGSEAGTLVFYRQDGQASTRFTWAIRENGQRVLRGVFLFDRSITHVLSELDTGVLDKLWAFSRLSNGTEVPIADNIRLLPGGALAGYSHPNEARWAFEGDTLVFYTAHGPASTRFTSLRMHHGRPEWQGRFAFDASVTHILRECDPFVTNKLWRFARRKDDGSGLAAIDFRLLSNHHIEGADNPQESGWDIDQDALVFHASDGAASTRFENPTLDTADDVFDFRGLRDAERRVIRVKKVSTDTHHELKESNIDLGWVSGSSYVSWIPVSDTSLGFQIARTRFAPLAIGTRLVVVTEDGRVFAHEIGVNTIGISRQLEGPPVAGNPWDRWMVTMGQRILVIVNDGSVFAHDLSDTSVSVASALAGPRVAANAPDRWVVTMNDRILVIPKDGRVFAHGVTHHSVDQAHQIPASPVGTNPSDKWVVTMGDDILVVQKDGQVFAHHVGHHSVATGQQLAGSPVAPSARDKWVLAMGRRIVVILSDGTVFAHDVTGGIVGPPVHVA